MSLDIIQTNVLYKCLRPYEETTRRDPRRPDDGRHRLGGLRALPTVSPRAHRHRHHQRRRSSARRSPGGSRSSLVKEGDTVKKEQLDRRHRARTSCAPTARTTRSSAEGLASQVRESEAALRYQEQQTATRSRRRRPTLARDRGAADGGRRRDLENARLTFDAHAESRAEADRLAAGARSGAHRVRRRRRRRSTRSNGRSTRSGRRSRWRASNAEQVAMRRSQLQTNEQQQAAAAAQRAKADVRLALHRDPRADRRHRRRARGARRAKSSTAGQPIVTLINPDDLWVRADVEETYIDRVRIGDKLTVRLPSGRRARGHGVLSRRRRRLRDAARRQPHQARHQDVRDPPARATTRIAGSPSA